MKKKHNTAINYSKYLPKEHKKEENKKPVHTPEEIKENYKERIAHLEKKIEISESRKKKMVKKTKEKYNILFGRSFGWIFMFVGFVAAFLLFGTEHVALDYIGCGTLAFLMLAYIVLQYFYSRSHVKKELEGHMQEFSEEQKKLDEKIVVLKEKCKNVTANA